MPPENNDLIPGLESGVLFSGPDDSIFDTIYDWIKAAIDFIVAPVVEFIQTVWANIVEFISSRVQWIWDKIYSWLIWVRDELWERVTVVKDWLYEVWSIVWEWTSKAIEDARYLIVHIVTSIKETLNELWIKTYSWVTDTGKLIIDSVTGFFANLGEYITDSFSWLWERIQTGFTTVVSSIGNAIVSFFKRAAEWIGDLLGAVGDWLTEDVPGSSPRWTGIFRSIGNWFATWFYEFPKWFFGDLPERVAYGLGESFKWVSDQLSDVIESFNSSIISFARGLGPMSPGMAVDNWSSIAKVGFAAIGGLTAMTIGGEMLHPLKRIGLGNLAAMIYDMTNYKMITGAFIGTMAYSMLQQPLRYYFNDLFRPMLLRERDFTELMSRRAFTDPDTLQNPELSAAISRLAPGGGADFESSMIGYYGLRSEYLGLYRELANTRLGYFALAGIARTGFWSESWFRESLARTGYSETARVELLKMFYELYVQTKIGPVQGLVRRQVVQGYMDQEEATAILDKAVNMPTLSEVRTMAMELEADYEEKQTALDVNLRAFSRGIISEGECYDSLSNFIKRGSMIALHLDREKLGIIKRITWTAPKETTPFEIVED